MTTGALKMYFRELPEPLFTYTLFHDFVSAISTSKNLPTAKRTPRFSTRNFISSSAVLITKNLETDQVNRRNTSTPITGSNVAGQQEVLLVLMSRQALMFSVVQRLQITSTGSRPSKIW